MPFSNIILHHNKYNYNYIHDLIQLGFRVDIIENQYLNNRIGILSMSGINVLHFVFTTSLSPLLLSR